MTKAIKFLFAGLLLLVSASTFAQCVPMNGEYRNRYGFVENAPRVYDSTRGCYVPQGTPQIPQQVMVNNNGYFQQQFYSTQQGVQLAQMGSGLSKCEVVGGVAGGTLGSLAVNNTSQATILGAIVGGIVGSAICQNPQGGQVLVQSNGQGQLVQQPFQQGNPCADQGRVPVNVNGQTMCKRPDAPQQTQQVQRVAQANPCADQGRIAVYKPDGNLGCKLPSAPAQPGERPYP